MLERGHLKPELLESQQMDLRSLRSFVMVVEQGGFTSASRLVGATQSTISKSVKQLEDELGIKLLERSRGGVVLTEAGALFHKSAIAMLDEKENLLRQLDDIRGLHKGTLRIGIPALFGSALFAAVFIEFRKQYPMVIVQLSEYPSELLWEGLLDGKIDIGISLVPSSHDLDYFPLYAEPLAVLLPRDHPLSRRASLKLLDVKEEGFILFPKGYALNDMIMSACERNSFVPREIARTTEIEFTLELIASGAGVGFLPRALLGRYSIDAVVPVTLDEPETSFSTAVVWRKDARLSSASNAWLRLTKQTFEKLTARTGNS